MFTARLALRTRGFTARCTLLPGKADDEWLARLVVEPAASASAEENRMFAALYHRHTRRSGFADRRLEPLVVSTMLQAADAESAHLQLVSTPGQRGSVLALAQSASRQRGADPGVRAELQQWTAAPGSMRSDGVPASAYLATSPTFADEPALAISISVAAGGLLPPWSTTRLR